MLIFVSLAVLGSSITAYEFFFTGNRKKNKSGMTYCEEEGKESETRLGKCDSFLKREACLNFCKSFLKCFCIVKNGKKILNNNSSYEQIDCIHGLRFLANAWVILMHTGLFYISSLKDERQAKTFLQKKASQFILSGPFTTDVFFVISGFLNSYHFSHHNSAQNENMNWICFYIKRFVRLTPMYMIALGFYSTLFTYIGTGVVWPTYNTNPVCRKDWWWHLLYISNFKESSHQCMGLYWSIATDMQMYIISPLYNILLIRWPRFGYSLLFASIAISSFASFMITFLLNLTDGISQYAYHLDDIVNFKTKYFEYFDAVYTKPYTRLSSYLVGYTLGYYLCSKSMKKYSLKNCKVALCCGWVMFATFMWICFNPPTGVIQLETAFYNGKKFLLFSCGVAWIIYVCFTGQSEYLNSFLSWKGFSSVSRLSYCACLIHPIILFREFLQANNTVDFSVISMLLQYLYIFVFTYIVSFVSSILFELPTINLFNYLSMKRKKKV